jgi:hypothetical protein
MLPTQDELDAVRLFPPHRAKVREELVQRQVVEGRCEERSFHGLAAAVAVAVVPNALESVAATRFEPRIDVCDAGVEDVPVAVESSAAIL